MRITSGNSCEQSTGNVKTETSMACSSHPSCPIRIWQLVLSRTSQEESTATGGITLTSQSSIHRGWSSEPGLWEMPYLALRIFLICFREILQSCHMPIGGLKSNRISFESSPLFTLLTFWLLGLFSWLSIFSSIKWRHRHVSLPGVWLDFSKGY